MQISAWCGLLNAHLSHFPKRHLDTLYFIHLNDSVSVYIDYADVSQHRLSHTAPSHGLSNWRQCLFAPNPPSESLSSGKLPEWLSDSVKPISHNTHIHFLSRVPRLCVVLFLLGPMRKLFCYFLCLVIRFSLPSRSDVSYSYCLIGMNGIYKR